MANAIEVEGLSRTFNSRRAVDDISFAVEAGEIFGFLGHIGVVSEAQNLYERMSARENLTFAARLYGTGNKQIDEALDQVGLLDRANDNVQQYSNGMKQRLLIARSLLHRPQIIFLDEPTRGLDPIVGRDIRRLVLDLSREGITVFLTTHYMEEADQLCSHVAFISAGKIVALDTPDNLKLAHGQKSLQVRLNDGQSLMIPLDDQGSGEQIKQLVSSGQIRTLHSAEATLEEVFIQMTGRKLSE